MNNDQTGDLPQFRVVNVDHLGCVLKAALKAKIGAFINVTTLHTNQKKQPTPYSQSKAEGEVVLSEVRGIRVINLRLPSVYGTEFSGRLGFLNRVPTIFRKGLFSLLATLKPTVHAKHVAEAILKSSNLSYPSDSIISDRQMTNRVYAFSKRVTDLAFAFSVIILLWWLLAIIWISIRITSPGPAIFTQIRIGKDGTFFSFYKFRTMYLGTQQDGTHQISGSAVTPIGKFLRRTKIDELPQIWNILRNDLSLVGPRPCLPVQAELVEARKIRGVLASKGGITGWAQVKGVDMSEIERLADLDAEYLALRTIPLDLKIILATDIGRTQKDKVN